MIFTFFLNFNSPNLITQILIIILKLSGYSSHQILKMHSVFSPLARPVLGIWVICRDDSCSLTMLYMIYGRSYEVSFDNIGPLYDEAWHKLAVHVTGMRKGLSAFASVYVDCALQGKKALLKNYNTLVPFVNKKPTSSQIWLAQRSRGGRGGFERPWRV